MITDDDLLKLQMLLSNIEFHVRCLDIGSETHDYYPEDCLVAIIDRFSLYDGSKLLQRLEKEILDRDKKGS